MSSERNMIVGDESSDAPALRRSLTLPLLTLYGLGVTAMCYELIFRNGHSVVTLRPFFTRGYGECFIIDDSKLKVQ